MYKRGGGLIRMGTKGGYITGGLIGEGAKQHIHKWQV